MVSLLTLGRYCATAAFRFLMVQIALVFSSIPTGARTLLTALHWARGGNIFALVTQGMRHLRHWQSWAGRWESVSARAIVLFAVLLAPST